MRKYEIGGLPHLPEATALPTGEEIPPPRILDNYKSPLLMLSLPGNPFPTSRVRTRGFLMM